MPISENGPQLLAAAQEYVPISLCDESTFDFILTLFPLTDAHYRPRETVPLAALSRKGQFCTVS